MTFQAQVTEGIFAHWGP